MDISLIITIAGLGTLCIGFGILVYCHHRCMAPKMEAIKQIAESKLLKAIRKIEFTFNSKDEKEDQLRDRVEIWMKKRIKEVTRAYKLLFAEHKGRIAGLRGIELNSKGRVATAMMEHGSHGGDSKLAFIPGK